MSIYCPLAEALGIPTTVSILDIKDYAHENSIVPGIRKGMSHSDDTKKLMSDKRKEYLEHNPAPMSGKKHSKDTKQKMSESRIQYLETGEGKKHLEKWQSAGQLSEKRKETSRQ